MHFGNIAICIPFQRNWNDTIIFVDASYKYIVPSLFQTDTQTTEIIKERHIKDVSQFLLKNMAFFFIPVAVSIMDNITYLQGHIMVFLLICIVATLLTFIATSYAVIGVMKLQEKMTAKRGQKHHE